MYTIYKIDSAFAHTNYSLACLQNTVPQSNSQEHAQRYTYSFLPSSRIIKKKENTQLCTKNGNWMRNRCTCKGNKEGTKLDGDKVKKVHDQKEHREALFGP